MFYVYILQSKKDKSFYIRFALNLKERIMKHNQGLVSSIKNILPIELIYYEAYKSKKDALLRERRLKQFAKGFSALKQRLMNFLLF